MSVRYFTHYFYSNSQHFQLRKPSIYIFEPLPDPGDVVHVPENERLGPSNYSVPYVLKSFAMIFITYFLLIMMGSIARIYSALKRQPIFTKYLFCERQHVWHQRKSNILGEIK